MVVAVSVVRVVQVAIDEVVDVVAVGDGCVAAAGTVHVVGIMTAAAVLWSADRGIRLAHLEPMLVDVAAVRVVEVAVV